MERLKFRAWDKNESRMIYSGTEQNDYPFAWMIHNSGIDIAEHDGTEWNYLKELIFMQFTGLHDKNGKEIYEGDILQDKRIRKFKVTWDNDIGSWVNSPYEDSKSYPWFNIGTVKDLEIIGNIYENPELLESEE